MSIMLMLACARHRAGKTLRRWYNGAGFKRKRALNWIFDLLHTGQHRQRRRALSGFLGASHVSVESVFRMAALSVFVMFFFVVFFFSEPRKPETRDLQWPQWRGTSASSWATTAGSSRARDRPTTSRRAVRLPRGQRTLVDLVWTPRACAGRNQQIYVVSADLHRLLDRFLAGVHRLASVHSAYINPNADIEMILVTDPLTVIALTSVIGFLTRASLHFTPSLWGR